MPRVSVADQSIYYRASTNDLTGRKSPLLLIHGAGGTHMHWPAALRRLPDWTVYALDLPGHGNSAPPGRDSIAAYRDVIYGVCQALQLPRVVLVGHSMGGAIVQDFALHFPQRLAGMALIGTAARLRVAPAILDGVRTDFPATARLITEWVHAQNGSEQLQRMYYQRLLEVDPEVLHGDFYACEHFDLRADTARLDTPALVVCGTADVMTPPKFSESLVQTLPNARLVLLPNVGHMAQLEAPEAVATAVTAFLEEIEARGK
ncbi:MAG: alpha/beta hydrolase [Anaerolineae bacterium]